MMRMMGESDMGYGEYYNYDGSWAVAPAEYDPGYQLPPRQHQPDDDYRYNSYA